MYCVPELILEVVTGDPSDNNTFFNKGTLHVVSVISVLFKKFLKLCGNFCELFPILSKRQVTFVSICITFVTHCVF